MRWALLTSAVRLRPYVRNHITERQLTLYSLDESASTLNWSTVEVGTAILCGSLSTLHPIASRLFPNFFSHFTHNTGTYPGTSIPSEPQMNKLESNSELSIMAYGGIYVQHSYEARELSDLPQEEDMMRRDINTNNAVPFDEMPGNEQLIRATSRKSGV